MLRKLYNKQKIFISYRRQDSGGHAGRLYDDLTEFFSESNVTKDIEKIQGGERYTDIIEQRIKASNVVLVVIGASWLNISEDGKRRLNDPEDLVSKEIQIALTNNIAIIPVLVQGARMPKKEELVDELKELVLINAIELSDLRWKYDVDRLIKDILKISPPKKRQATFFIGSTLFIAVLLMLLYFTTDLFKPQPANAITEEPKEVQNTTTDSFNSNTNVPERKPVPMIGVGFTADAFAQALPILGFREWKPKFVVVHNTVTPNFSQWHSTPAHTRLKAFANLLGIQNGWSSGPHLFVADDSIWVFNDLEKPGIHSPSWNKISWGIEMVGDYSTEKVDLMVENNAVHAIASLFHILNIPANDTTIRFHSEDPKAHKICPGKNLDKKEFVSRVAALLK